jgi:hypothetical protein
MKLPPTDSGHPFNEVRLFLEQLKLPPTHLGHPFKEINLLL